MQSLEKQAEFIQAYARGEKLQFRHSYSPIWADYVNTGTWNFRLEYRIKPKTIMYRNFLRKSLCNDRVVVCVVEAIDQKYEPRESWSGFIKWLGDWQEVGE